MSNIFSNTYPLQNIMQLRPVTSTKNANYLDTYTTCNFVHVQCISEVWLHCSFCYKPSQRNSQQNRIEQALCWICCLVESFFLFLVSFSDPEYFGWAIFHQHETYILNCIFVICLSRTFLHMPQWSNEKKKLCLGKGLLGFFGP